MTELVLAAFEALGMGATRRELGLVAKALRDSGDEETLALFYEPESYGDGYRRLVDISQQAGAGGFVALDLYVEVVNPGALGEVRDAER
jgi:hypothetical protein